MVCEGIKEDVLEIAITYEGVKDGDVLVWYDL